ncbi:TRF2-interacting telomeric protein/Rap1 C terminal domain-containing protein [Trichoderma novae-zelandiae]
MASHITYDGVTGAGGNIFTGIKFWVSISVPQRQSVIEKIWSNGGVVVPREKDADMLIADHVKRNAPPGSYSWKFITESVNAGIIQVEDKYLIEPPPPERRSILAGAHAKRFRTPFTDFDDALLTKYVLENGGKTAGNVMYMKLEDEYPHHTWQSWRNRWVKCLSFKSNEEKHRLARLANVDLENAPITPKPLIGSHQRLGGPQAPRADATPSAGREPSRNRTEPSPRTSRASTSEAARRPEAVPSNGRTGRSSTGDAVPEPSGGTVEEGTTIGQDADDRDEPATAKDSEAGEDEPEEGQESGQEDAGADLPGEQEEEDAEDDVSVDGGLSSLSERGQFFSDLKDYCEATHQRLHTRCVIEDHEVDLFDLYQAVSAQSLPPDEVDWVQVAEAVDLGRTQSKVVTAGLLESSYRRYLGDFVEAMMSFEDNEEDPDEDIAEEEGAALGDEETAARSTTPRPSQEDRISSSMLSDSGEPRLRKRLPDERPLTPENLSKRRRTMPTEIPMTPEDKLRTNGRLPGPSSAPGNLHRILDEEEAETEEPSHKTPRQQQSPAEALDVTPSQQLRSETELFANPEDAETPTLHYSPTAARLAQRSDGHLETIQEEEVPSTYTPTRSSLPKKRALPPSFEQAQPTPSREPRGRGLKEELERRRQQQQEEQRQQERRREDIQAHEQGRGPALQQEVDGGREQRPQQDSADVRDPGKENTEEGKKKLRRCKKDYLRRGFSEHEIVEAMRRTTMIPGEPMDIVLESLRAGRGIPDNCEGIWTDRDDSQLRYVVRVGGLEVMPGGGAERRRCQEKAQKMLDRLVYKHGRAGVELRKEFLRDGGAGAGGDGKGAAGGGGKP